MTDAVALIARSPIAPYVTPPPFGADLLATLQAAVGALDASGARWALIGGIALCVRGWPRSTKDVDIAVAPGDFENAKRRLGAAWFESAPDVGGGAVGDPGWATSFTLAGPVPAKVHLDLLVPSHEALAGLFARATREPLFEGLAASVVSVEDLIILKLKAGRMRDLGDIEDLLRSGTVVVDQGYLKATAATAGVGEALKRFVS